MPDGACQGQSAHSICLAAICASGRPDAGYQRAGNFCRMLMRFFSMLM